MRHSLRRQFFWLRAYAVTSSLILIVLVAAGFRQVSPAKNLGEITVERMNVVDANGTLRMVLAGKDRMHPGVMDGVTIDRPRPVAGMLFFNDEGDEVGGLTYTGQVTGGRGRANAGLMFDQLKQDQTIGISYSEGNGQRSAGFQVWDRSDTVRLSELITKLNAANKLPREPSGTLPSPKSVRPRRRDRAGSSSARPRTRPRRWCCLTRTGRHG